MLSFLRWKLLYIFSKWPPVYYMSCGRFWVHWSNNKLKTDLLYKPLPLYIHHHSIYREYHGSKKNEKDRKDGVVLSINQIPTLTVRCRQCCETKTCSCVCYTCKQIACSKTCYNNLQGSKCHLCRRAAYNGKSPWIINWWTMTWINKKILKNTKMYIFSQMLLHLLK